ncbi:MAG TPA: adenylate/guanylate cyclase domain-containing protein [Nitrospirae bacterium]|nr:adenylate/guanylate cyclase domain-containing protein [Nitrospirota bacterium]
MTKVMKSVVLGLFTGVLGVVLSLTTFGHGLEENLGLSILFSLRGKRKPPPDVVVVNIDKASSDALNLPNRPVEWSRALHAKVVENLRRAGAEVIVFDVTFDEESEPRDDRIFAEAVGRAGNVVFCEFLKKEVVPIERLNNGFSARLDIEELVPPIPLLSERAAALAPFPLPKLPFRVNQYWTFKTSAGDTPTLPVVAFQIYAFQVYDEFIGLLRRQLPGWMAGMEILSLSRDELSGSGRVVEFVRAVREIFRKDPDVAERMLAELRAPVSTAPEMRKRRILRALIRMYLGPDSRYINFYGPSRTITTVPYHEVLNMDGGIEDDGKGVDFSGKVVFIGQAETKPYLQKDGFYTVFTTSDGLDLNGVEIAATAFANILEDKPVRPLRLPLLAAVVFSLGLLLGAAAFVLPSLPAAVVMVAVNALYVSYALYEFSAGGIWYPVVVPGLILSPVAFFGALAWKYVDAGREKLKIKRAFSYYLPEEIVDTLIKNLGDVRAEGRVVSGTCLYTDLEHYTSLSEAMEPEELRDFIRKYYETIFNPVKMYGGVVSNVVADSMLALWVSAVPDDLQRERACLAALDLADAVKAFNRSSGDMRISTRVGLHFGRFLLGNIGAIDHYEYRPIGDIVNTTTRIEGLNKYLGTYLLASEETVAGVDGILTRELGSFILYGKVKPVRVFELVSRADRVTGDEQELCFRFAEALAAFRERRWDCAERMFSDIIGRYGEDGPSRYYLYLISYYRNHPPPPSWGGVICVEKK